MRSPSYRPSGFSDTGTPMWRRYRCCVRGVKCSTMYGIIVKVKVLHQHKRCSLHGKRPCSCLDLPLYSFSLPFLGYLIGNSTLALCISCSTTARKPHDSAQRLAKETSSDLHADLAHTLPRTPHNKALPSPDDRARTHLSRFFTRPFRTLRCKARMRLPDVVSRSVEVRT